MNDPLGITKMEDWMPGDLVRAKCGAAAVYIGGGLCIFVSAMDNDLCVDDAKEMWEHDFPVIEQEEAETAATVVRYFQARKGGPTS